MLCWRREIYKSFFWIIIGEFEGLHRPYNLSGPNFNPSSSLDPKGSNDVQV